MNKILKEIQKIIADSIRENLPSVTPDMLEKQGTVFYMNGNNGTEFDWYVNERLSNFMVFYNDSANLGIVKASLYKDGGLQMYLYDDQGRHVAREISTYLDAEEEALRSLAVILRMNADDKRVWDADIEEIDTDVQPSEGDLEEFVSHGPLYEKSIERKRLMNKIAVVSKKVLEEGWKVGYMSREEARDEKDSGWMLYAGNESDEYTGDSGNFALCYLNYLLNRDPALMSCIDRPAGSSLVRVSSDQFEEDRGQEIHMEKWMMD